MVELSKIYKAQNKINEILKQTLCSYAPRLSSELGLDVYLKKENLQLTGSYKIRGAYNKISSLTDEEKDRGIIASSAGNHAQGVAYSAKLFNIKATIVMPEATPLTKVNGVLSYGADVKLEGANYDESYKIANEYALRENLCFIHPYEDDAIVEGQGTVGLEILNSLDNIGSILIPIGGGGLVSGVGSAVKHINPDIKIVGVVAEGSPINKAFNEKRPVVNRPFNTIADGISVRKTSEKNFKHILGVVDEIAVVDNDEIASAILFLLENQKLVVEGAGSVGVAALLHKKVDISKLKDKKVVVILTGGNIDINMLNVIIEKGLIKTGRKVKINIVLIDKPGSLLQLTNLLNSASANIVNIEYDRTSTRLAYGNANVTLSLETKGEAHKEEVLNILKDSRYIFNEIV